MQVKCRLKLRRRKLKAWDREHADCTFIVCWEPKSTEYCPIEGRHGANTQAVHSTCGPHPNTCWRSWQSNFWRLTCGAKMRAATFHMQTASQMLAEDPESQHSEDWHVEPRCGWYIPHANLISNAYWRSWKSTVWRPTCCSKMRTASQDADESLEALISTCESQPRHADRMFDMRSRDCMWHCGGIFDIIIVAFWTIINSIVGIFVGVFGLKSVPLGWLNTPFLWSFWEEDSFTFSAIRF